MMRGGYLRALTDYMRQIPVVSASSVGGIEDATHAAIAAKATNPAADVSALEAEIDRLVYALYGLTPAEIRIVEGG